MNQKIANLHKSLSLLHEKGWIIESDRNKIYVWHPDSDVFEGACNKLKHFNWKVDGILADKLLVFYL